MSATLTASRLLRRPADAGGGGVPFGPVSLALQPGRVLVVRGAEPECSALAKCLFRTYEPASGRLELEVAGERMDLARAGPRTVAWVRARWMGLHDGHLRALPNRPASAVAGGEVEALRGLGLQRAETAVGLLDDRERHIVGLAAALHPPAPVLLLHRPLRPLAGAAREYAWGLIAAARDAGSAVLITADGGEPSAFADSELHLDDGRGQA